MTRASIIAALTTRRALGAGGGSSPTYVTSTDAVFAVEATSGSSAATVAGSNIAVFAAPFGFRFDAAATISTCRFGGASGTVMTQLATGAFYFGNGTMSAYGYAPGPTGSTDVYTATTGIVSGISGAFYSNVNQTTPFADGTFASAAFGDPISTTTIEITIPNTVAGQICVASAIVSPLDEGSAPVAPFTDVGSGETTVIRTQDSGQLASVVLFEKVATGSSTTLRVNANLTGSGGLVWAAVGARVMPL